MDAWKTLIRIVTKVLEKVLQMEFGIIFIFQSTTANDFIVGFDEYCVQYIGS